MLLKSLELKRFKKFRQARIEFSPGLNIIFGPNESGKSTLRSALTTVLFGNPTSVSEASRALTSWGSDARIELNLEYVDERGAACMLRKDFSDKKVFLIKGEESLRSFKSIQTSVFDTLGIASEELFQLCSSLDVRTLGNLGSSAEQRQVNKMLSGMMTGSQSGGDIDQALKKLKEVLTTLGKGARGQAVKTPGPIRYRRDQLMQLKARYQQIQDELAGQKRQLDEKRAIEQTLKDDEKRNADLIYLLEGNRKLLAAEKRLEELAAQDDALAGQVQRIREGEESLCKLQEALRDSPLGGITAEDIEVLHRLDLEMASIPTQDLTRSSSDKSSWKPLMIFGGVFFAGGIILLIQQWLAGMLLILGGGGLFGVAFLKKREADRLRKQSEETRQWQENERQRLQSQYAAIFGKSRLSTTAEIYKAWPAHTERQVECATWQKQLASMSAPDEEKWREIRREMRMIEDLLQETDLKALKLTARDAAAHQREQEALSQTIAAKQERLGHQRAALARYQADGDSLRALEEEIEKIDEELARYEAYEAICEKTYRFLDRARRDTLNPARKVLEERAGALMAAFSQNRYANIAVDDEDLSCKILIPETQTWETPQVLSQGTFDQFYLSLRLALSEILANGRMPPILLDEPLAAFDAERSAAMLEMLRIIARERQVLFFTCKREYLDAADGVVDLTLSSEKRAIA